MYKYCYFPKFIGGDESMSDIIDVNVLIAQRDAYQHDLNQCSQWSEFNYRQYRLGFYYDESAKQAWLRQMIDRLDMKIQEIQKIKEVA